MDLQFQYPQFLWALAAIPVFIFLYAGNLLWRRRVAKRIGDPALVKDLYKEHAPLKALVKYILMLLAFAAGCIALANPRKADESTAEARKGIDIAIALDVSNSMLAADVLPNRLRNAKNLILQLMKRLPDDRVSLIAFAGNAYVQMPLTFDHSTLELILSSTTPSSFRGQGTAIGDALNKSDLSFQEDSKRFKSIVLITDGETHDENALDQAKELSSKGVMINTVGIGSAAGATIIDTVSGGTKKDLSGNVVVSRLNEPLLQQIAKLTNGQYVPFSTAAETTDLLVQQLAQIEKRAYGDTSQFNYTSFYLWFAWPMFVFLLVEIFIPDRKKLAV